jgi:hypothetical protein
MYFPSNFELTMVGNDLETLTLVLDLIRKGGHGHVDGYVAIPAKLSEPDHESVGALARLPVLAFYAFGKPHNGEYVEKKFSNTEGLSHFIYSWLHEVQDYGARPDTDGSVKKGWRLSAGYSCSDVGVPNYSSSKPRYDSLTSLYPELSFYAFQFAIRPEWTFYAK